MADENLRADEGREPEQSGNGRRWLIRLGALALAFLLGLLPMWWAKMGVDHDLAQANRELRRSQILNLLSSAAVYARRGEYETARQNVSSFFTDVQAELDNAASTVLTPAERTQMPQLLSGRDDLITLLSRGDPASGERLSDLYVGYRVATGSALP